MRVLLVYPIINNDYAVSHRYNYGVGYVAAILKSGGHEVDLAVIEDKNDVTDFIRKMKIKRPAVVGFSVTSNQVGHIKPLVHIAKTISDSLVVCGGVHPTLDPEGLFRAIPSIDCVIRGEGEYPMNDFIGRIGKNENFCSIENVWGRENGRIIKNAQRPFIADLDTLPFPDKDSLDYQDVITKSGGINRFIFSRGCPFECAYCSNKALSELSEGVYFRQQSPKRAIEEIERDLKRFKFDSIIFDDDIISINKGWFYEFFHLYKKEFKIPFACNIKPGTIDSDMIGLLKECGVSNVGIGVETGNEYFRKTVLKRNMSNKKILETVELCNKYNIPHYEFLMLGLPFETRNLFFDTVRLCRRIKTTGWALYIFHPYPGTELGRICKDHNWKPSQESFTERNTAVINYPNFKKEEIQCAFDYFDVLLNVRHLLFLPFFPLKWLVHLNIVLDHIVKRLSGRKQDYNNTDTTPKA